MVCCPRETVAKVIIKSKIKKDLARSNFSKIACTVVEKDSPYDRKRISGNTSYFVADTYNSPSILRLL